MAHPRQDLKLNDNDKAASLDVTDIKIATNQTGHSVLPRVVYNIEDLRRLVDAGANLNTIRLGHTTLTLAVQAGNKEMVRMLIEAKADLDIPESNNGLTALLIAIYRRDTEMARMLINGGAKLNITDCTRATPLITAVRSCQIEIVRLLIEAGADLHVVNCFGSTAFTLARKTNAELVKVLAVAAEREKAMAMVSNLRHCPSSFFSRMPRDIIDYVLKPRVMHISDSELTIDSVTQNKSP